MFHTGGLFAQSKIILIDSITSQPLSSISIKFTNRSKDEFKWVISDYQGIAINPLKDSSFAEIISHGYEYTKINLNSGQTITLILHQNAVELPEIIVTSNFLPTSKRESVYDIKIISNEKINNKGATNLREVLNTELNFKTNNGHVNETAINLNGLSGNHIKIMIDGVPLEGRLNGNIDLSQINLNEVERIEIIDGPSSVSYGTNALGGTINIITKKSLTKKISGNIKGYYETVGQYNFSGNIGFKLKENNFKLSGGRNYFNGYNDPDTSRFKTWKPREQYFGSFLYNKKIKQLKFSYILDAFSETMTSRGEPKPPYFIKAFDTYYLTKRMSNKILLNGKISKNNYLDLTFSQSYYNRIRNIYYKDLTTLNQVIISDDQDTSTFINYLFRGVFTQKRDSSKLNTAVGLEFKQDYIIANRVLNNRQQIGDYAIFFSLEYKPIQKLIIKPAARFAYNTMYKAPIIPSLNILYHLNDAIQIRASIAKGYRAPDLKELFLEFHYNSSINLWGNTNLVAENSNHFNLSIDYTKKYKKHSIQITPKIYYSKINNLISLAQFSPVDWAYSNIDYLTTRGSSLTIIYQYQKLNITAGYNFYQSYNSIFDNSIISNKFFPTSSFNSTLTYKLDSLSLSFNLAYKYTGEIRNYYLTPEKEIKDSYIGDYHVFDFSINKSLFNQKLSVILGVKNLFDTKRVLMIGDVFGMSNQNDSSSLNVLWGRSYFISLNYMF